ncbi:MAG: CBS domain-containing protein [Alphaproteobacteria bacterium]|nr:CBS domain-containing protein [Alphaproteobacteria bacterium]
MAYLSQTFTRTASTLGRVLRNRQLVLFILGLATGAIAAGASIGFREMIALVQTVALGFGSERVASFAAQQPWWRILLAPVAGGLLIGLFIRYVLPNGRPQGVPHVMEAVALRAGRIHFRTGIAAAVASAASIGCGASVGREGPVVHLGAALSSSLARRLHLSRGLTLTLLGCGVASAIAASFNAPIAGVFFALEVVVGHYALSSFAPIVIASVTGTIITRLYYGNAPAFEIPPRMIASFLEFPAFALLGIVSAFIAVAFIKGTALVEDNIGRVPVPDWTRPGIAGLAVGVAAIWYPQVLGVGYEVTDAALAEKLTLGMLVALFVLKFALSALCLGAGFSGGVFSPALVMGALAGGAFGLVAGGAFPHLSSGPGAYAIVGMGAVAGAILGAPISTILIIFELTSNFTLTIAVMIGVVIASVITQQVAGKSFFVVQLERRGISLAGGRETSLLRSRKVADILRSDFERIAADLPMPEVRARLQADPHGELFVVDADGSGRLAGTITLQDLGDAAFDTARDGELSAARVARLSPPALTLDADLEDARRMIETAGEDQVAVVADTESLRLVGCVHARDVMQAYQSALLQARAEERGEA